MYEQNRTLTQLPRFNTTSVYDILSVFTNSLSQLISNAYRILVLTFQDQNYQKIHSLNELQQKIAESALYNLYSQEELSGIQLSKMIKKRLINRVIEIILPYKNQASKYQYMKPLLSLVSQLQQNIIIFYEEESLIALIKSIKQNFVTFSSVIKVLGNLHIANPNHSAVLLENTLKKSTPMKEPLSATKYESQATKKYKKILSSLNKGFKAYSCMDLEYAHFRNSYFEIKNDGDLFPDLMRRNTQIRQKMVVYREEFQEYKARKKNRNFQKKMSFNTENQARKTQRSFNQLRILSRRISTKIEDKTQNMFDITEKVDEASDRRKKHSMKSRKTEYEGLKINLSPIKKTQIKMKSIVLTADQYKIEPIRNTNYKTFNPIKYSLEYRKKTKKKDQKIYMHELKSLTKRFGES